MINVERKEALNIDQFNTDAIFSNVTYYVSICKEQ